MTKFVECVDQTNDEDSSLDIFQQIASTSEPLKELITKELLIFKHCQVDPKDTNVIFNGGENMKPCFIQLVFCFIKFQTL
jgi:hypothetical protein